MANLQVAHDSSTQNARSESSIAINPTNPLQIVSSSKKFANIETYNDSNPSSPFPGRVCAVWDKTDSPTGMAFARANETRVQSIVHRAWMSRILTSVSLRHGHPEHPLEIILHGAPPHRE